MVIAGWVPVAAMMRRVSNTKAGFPRTCRFSIASAAPRPEASARRVLGIETVRGDAPSPQSGSIPGRISRTRADPLSISHCLI
jgi:hypothetical protein